MGTYAQMAALSGRRVTVDPCEVITCRNLNEVRCEACCRSIKIASKTHGTPVEVCLTEHSSRQGYRQEGQ